MGYLEQGTFPIKDERNTRENDIIIPWQAGTGSDLTFLRSAFVKGAPVQKREKEKYILIRRGGTKHRHFGSLG